MHGTIFATYKSACGPTTCTTPAGRLLKLCSAAPLSEQPKRPGPQIRVAFFWAASFLPVTGLGSQFGASVGLGTWSLELPPSPRHQTQTPPARQLASIIGFVSPAPCLFIFY